MERIVVDENGRRRRFRRKVLVPDEQDSLVVSEEDDTTNGSVDGVMKAKGRECPLPKPGGIIGQVLGFKSEERPAVEVEVEPARSKHNSDTGA